LALKVTLTSAGLVSPLVPLLLWIAPPFPAVFAWKVTLVNDGVLLPESPLLRFPMAPPLL
jgi:hypothetical protein